MLQHYKNLIFYDSTSPFLDSNKFEYFKNYNVLIIYIQARSIKSCQDYNKNPNK